MSFDLAMRLDAGRYALPYLRLREVTDDLIAAALFPLCTYCLLHSASPPEFYLALTDRLRGQVDLERGRFIEQAWRSLYSDVRREAELFHRISKEVGNAARMLPTIAGVSNALCSDSGPHQAVTQLCDLRNDFFHVNYAMLKERLPNASTLMRYFKRFVEAMEDMHVVPMRDRPHGPLNVVLTIGEFHCK